MRQRLAGLGLAATMIACQSAPTPDDRSGQPVDSIPAAAPDGPIALRTDSTQYAAGASVGLSLTSSAEATYSFNPCTRSIEMWDGAAWVGVEEEDRICTMEAWLIEPGATRTATTELPRSLDAGQYRLVIAFTREADAQSSPERLRAISPPFSVGERGRRTGAMRPALSDSSAGCLQIGATPADLGRGCRVLSDRRGPGPEGMPERRIAVASGTDTIEATIVNDSVWRIEVLSKSFRTSDSLGVGTSVTRLLANPEARGIQGEGGLFVVRPDHCGLSFELAATAPDSIAGRPADDIVRMLPPQTPVRRVLVIGCDQG